MSDTLLERPRRRGNRRREIIEGAAAQFAEYGYYGASLRDISARVGISHPGMLHHFSTKMELLGGVIDRLEAHAQEALDHVEDLAASPDDLIEGLLTRWDPSSAPVQLLAALDADTTNEDHPGRFRMARLRRVHEHVLEQCFLRFAQRGVLCEGIHPGMAARATLALVLQAAIRERTVRTMQADRPEDSPGSDLRGLVRAFTRS